MVRVFRIEHPNDGIGPYTGRLPQYKWADEYHDHRSGRPEPEDDNIDHDDNYFYGFKTTKQLSAWFTKQERINLINAGFRLKVYSVPETNVISGNKQVAFTLN